MSTVDSLSNYPDVSFTDNMSLDDIKDYYLTAMQQKYKELTGEELILAEADPIRLIAYTDCLLLYQIMQYAERAGKMALLKYSFGDYLVNIGALKGIHRIEGAAAKATIQFTLSTGRNTTTIIPAKTRVTARDGMYFETLEILEVPAGRLSGTVNAVCKEIGIKGNDYKIGDLNVLVDPVAYIKSVENITVAEGGADRETDRNLAERIYLAPSSWSTAGPDDAYKYWVRTYNPAISDVRVDSEEPGYVDIKFILQGGTLPDETMLEELEKYLQNEEIRPLTDSVRVQAPDIQDYTIDLTYYVNESDRARAAAIQEQVRIAVEEYRSWQQEKIGRDINPDQLRKKIISAGAKRVEIRSPEFVKIPKKGIAIPVQDATIIYGGVEDD